MKRRSEKEEGVDDTRREQTREDGRTNIRVGETGDGRRKAGKTMEKRSKVNEGGKEGRTVARL